VLGSTRAWIRRVLLCARDKYQQPIFQHKGQGLLPMLTEMLRFQGWPEHLIAGEAERRMAEAQLSANPFPGV
jgi:hypothetical protein